MKKSASAVVAMAIAALLPFSALGDSRRRLASPGDSRAPQLMAVWLDHISMRAGEQNTLFVRAEDDRSGVALISGVFLSPAKHARIGFACHAGSAGVWECNFAVPVCLDCGGWQLEQLQLQDRANNLITERFDNPLLAAVQLYISGDSCVAEAPNLAAIALDRNVISSSEAGTIVVTGTFLEATCGLAGVIGQAVGPAGGAQPRIYFAFSPGADPNTWVGRITLPKLAAKGVWSIAWIQVLDKGYNLKAYSASDAVLAGAVFRVE